MSDEKKVHPLRRKHRRGKRGGKKHRRDLQPTNPAWQHDPTIPPPSAATIRSLRARLTALSRKAG